MPGGMGGGGSASVNVEPISAEAARVWGLDAVEAYNASQTALNSSYTMVMTLIGTVGLIKQWQALEDSVAIAARHAVVAEKHYDLTERNYEEIALDAYMHQKQLFQKYEDDFADVGLLFVDTAKGELTYNPAYAMQEGRALAGIGSMFTRLRLRRQRQRDKFAVGLAEHEELSLDIAQAQATVEATNRGYAFEVERKMHMDQWFWNRFMSAAEFIATMRGHVISGINGGVAGASGALQVSGSAVGHMGNAAQMRIQANNNMASFYGSVSNGAFGMAGALQGMGSSGGSLMGSASAGPAAPVLSQMRGGGSGSSVMGAPGYMNGGMASPFGSSIRDPMVVAGGFNVGWAKSLGYT